METQLLLNGGSSTNGICSRCQLLSVGSQLSLLVVVGGR
jgi:hypothetical protein